MSPAVALDPVQAITDADADHQQPTEQFDFSGPWFTPRTAAAYVGSKSVKAFYEWRRRHGIIPRANHTVAKRDLDRALAPRRLASRRGRHPNSRANLTKGRSHGS